MHVRRAPLVALGCTILLSSCGLGTAGLSGSDDAGAKGVPDATGTVEASSPTGDTGSGGPPEASDLRESAPGDADDGATGVSDSAGGATDSPADANVEAATGADAGDTSDAGASGDAVGVSDASYPTDATDAANDAGSASDAGGALDAAADAGSACDAAGACIVVPTGWTLVAFAPTQASSCPSGFGQSDDLVEGPGAASACACGTCGVTTQPSCATGPIQVFYDTLTSTNAGTCNLPGTVTPLGNAPPGACLTDLYQGDYRLDDLEYVPSGPSGGVCSAPGATTPGNLTYTAHDRTCTPSSAPSAGCNGTVCTPTPGSPYAACITAPGDVACPSGSLTARHLVGTDTSFDCSACTCTVTGNCTGTVTLYSDTKCHVAALPVPADGSCNRIIGLTTKPATSYSSYSYQGDAPTQVGCDTSGSSSAENVALVNEATICCAP